MNRSVTEERERSATAPISQQSRSMSCATRTFIDTRLEGVRILVVDDHPPSAKLLRVLLGQAGCELRIAGTAEEALALLEGFPARIVVLDLLLPCMSGFALAAELKADPSTRQIVLIAVSALRGVDAELLAKRAGCAAFVTKPFDTDSIIDLLTVHLERAEQGRMLS